MSEKCLNNMPATKGLWAGYVRGIKNVAKQETIFDAALKAPIAFAAYSLCTVFTVAMDISRSRNK